MMDSSLETPTKPKNKKKYKYEVIRIQDGSYPTPSSKYDFVKVKVWLEDHYYILSRFLVSRVLNVTQVDPAGSVRIALELKKRLVDQGIFEVSQAEMENQLFQILQSYGYGNEYIYRYRMSTKFHHQRVPLIILIMGTRCVGKSWLATQLAERLNLSTVLQTNLVYDLMYTIMKDLPPSVGSPYPPASDIPLLYRDMDAPTMIKEYRRECMMIRDGIDTDIEKCFEEGKAIIIEGYNLDPALFLEMIERRNMASIRTTTTTTSTTTAASAVAVTTTTTTTPTTPLEETNNSKAEKDAEKEKKKTVGKGIVIPFILGMNQREHKLLIENWLSCSTQDRRFAEHLATNVDEQVEIVVERFQGIQSYLFSCVPPTTSKYVSPYVRVDVNTNAFMNTLDVLHSAVLERIQQVYNGDGFALQ